MGKGAKGPQGRLDPPVQNLIVEMEDLTRFAEHLGVSRCAGTRVAVDPINTRSVDARVTNTLVNVCNEQQRCPGRAKEQNYSVFRRGPGDAAQSGTENSQIILSAILFKKSLVGVEATFYHYLIKKNFNHQRSEQAELHTCFAELAGEPSDACAAEGRDAVHAGSAIETSVVPTVVDVCKSTPTNSRHLCHIINH